MVRSGFVIAWRFATSPTRISPFLENPTTEGVVRAPSEFGMTTGSPPSSADTTEFVVPRSIPTALDIGSLLLACERLSANRPRRSYLRLMNLESDTINFVSDRPIPGVDSAPESAHEGPG